VTNRSTAYHEASHAVAAFERGLSVVYLSIRPHEDDAGRTAFDTQSEGFQRLAPFDCAIIKVAGEIGARMYAGETRPVFNWLSEGGDAEDAIAFIARVGGDELDARHWAVVRAYALLRTRWDAVEELAALLQRETTVLGEDVSRICLAEAARRRARSDAANPVPKPFRPKPAKGTADPDRLQVVVRELAELKRRIDAGEDDPELNRKHLELSYELQRLRRAAARSGDVERRPFNIQVVKKEG